MNSNDRVLSLLGLSLRGGNLVVGEEPVDAAARAKDARLLLPKTRTLAPNETIRFQPPRTGAMLHYLGTGGREEFLARVKATAEFLK